MLPNKNFSSSKSCLTASCCSDLCYVSGRHDEALAIAERGRTRAFADLLVERQKGSQQAANTDPYIPVTVENILETVNSQRAVVLYYSLAGGFLYSWLIAPGSGKYTHLHTFKQNTQSFMKFYSTHLQNEVICCSQLYFKMHFH